MVTDGNSKTSCGFRESSKDSTAVFALLREPILKGASEESFFQSKHSFVVCDHDSRRSFSLETLFQLFEKVSPQRNRHLRGCSGLLEQSSELLAICECQGEKYRFADLAWSYTTDELLVATENSLLLCIKKDAVERTIPLERPALFVFPLKSNGFIVSNSAKAHRTCSLSRL